MTQTPERRPVVAIDGPAGVGKSTVARAVAGRLGYRYIDTGAMYRTVGLVCLRRGVELEDAARAAAVAEELRIDFAPAEDGGQRVLADGEDVSLAIRTAEMGEVASRVSAIPRVREVLVRRQREMGRAGGVVMEGRDIQTNVFPDAEVKVFLTASEEERARRRARDLAERGLDVPPAEELIVAIRQRDGRDSTRDTAPLTAAPDATIVDTDGLTVEQVVAIIADLVRKAERRC